MKSFLVVLLLWACSCGAEESKEPFLDAPRGLGNSTAAEKLILSKNETVASKSVTKSNATLPENATLSVKNEDSGHKNISAQESDENVDENADDRINVDHAAKNATKNATDSSTANPKANTTDAVAKNVSISAPEGKMIANKTKAGNSSDVLIKRDMMGGGGGDGGGEGGGGGGGGGHGCMDGPCIDAEPGYYSQECHAQKKCNDPKKFCHMYTCTDCLKDNIVCTNNGQCCDGSICIYGRCAKGSKGSKVPGKFCDRQDDCASDACCVHEHQINPIIKICKPKLSKHQTCGPHNQFHQSDEHGAVDAACEPCKGKLQCKQVGLFGVHEICLDP